MATGISSFGITSSGNNINFSFTWEGFTCASNPRIIVSLIDTASNTSVASLEYTSGIDTVGTIVGTFNNIYNGIFYAIARFTCDGARISSYTSQNLTHSTSTVPAPSSPPTAPSSGPTGVGTNNVNPNNNPSFCINTGGVDISFSGLNVMFGRSANTPDTSLSGLSNPSQPPSLMGLSYLPLNVVAPGKLIQNAVSEFRGTCSYGAPNEYFFALVVTPVFMDGTVITRNFEGIWIHEPSGNITNRCPFNNSIVRIFTSVRIQSQYVGSTVPSPYSVTVTRINNSGGSTNFTTTRAANSLGITTNNHDITLSYRDRIVGTMSAQSNVVEFTQDFDVRVQVNSPDTLPNQLASVNIGAQSNLQEIRVTRTVVPVGNFNFEWQNSVGSGVTSSVLSVSSVFTNTISSSIQTGSGNSNQTGNRTVSITPTPSSAHTTLIIFENNSVIYNLTQMGEQSVVINFQSGFNYRIEGTSTTAIQ